MNAMSSYASGGFRYIHVTMGMKKMNHDDHFHFSILRSRIDLDQTRYNKLCIGVCLTGYDSIDFYNFEVLSSRPTRLGWPSFFGRVTA